MRALKQFVVCLIAATLVAACVVAGGSAALARDRDGGFRGEGQHSWSGSHPHGFSRGQKVGWHGSWVPPGWSKGRKTGWNGHHVPPGWFKGRKSGWNEHHVRHGLHSEMDDDHQD